MIKIKCPESRILTACRFLSELHIYAKLASQGKLLIISCTFLLWLRMSEEQEEQE